MIKSAVSAFAIIAATLALTWGLETSAQDLRVTPASLTVKEVSLR